MRMIEDEYDVLGDICIFDLQQGCSWSGVICHSYFLVSPALASDRFGIVFIAYSLSTCVISQVAVLLLKLSRPC